MKRSKFSEAQVALILRQADEGATVGDVLANLDRRYPGMRFRMIDEQDRVRTHIRLYVNTKAVESLGVGVRPGDTLHLICALSGG